MARPISYSGMMPRLIVVSELYPRRLAVLL